MVKRPYVIIVGVNPGVHFKNWIEVAPLVKNYPSSVYQSADSEEEAWELFENARLKGQVRDLSLPLGSSTSPGPQAASARRSSSSSASSTQHPKHTPASRPTVSRSEAHSVSPARSNFRGPNTVSAVGRTTTSINRVITVSKTHSEPNPPMSASNSLKKVYVQGYPASHGTEAFSSVGATNRQIRTRVESPPWLASYPDDETEQPLSPALSPIASPVISSRSFESHRPVPFSTPSNSRHDREAVEHTGYDSSELVKSPVPSFRRQEVRGGSSFGIDQASESKNAALGGSPKNSRHNGADLQLQDDIDPFVQLVVDEVLRRLHPSARVKDELLPDRILERPSRPNGHNDNTQSERRSKRSNVLSPGSHSQRSMPLPASGTKNLSSPGVPNGSILFDHGRDNLGSLGRNSPSKRKGLCQHCKGTGYDTGHDTSVLDEDPRSPFRGLKKLASPFTFRRPSPIVSQNISAKTSF